MTGIESWASLLQLDEFLAVFRALLWWNKPNPKAVTNETLPLNEQFLSREDVSSQCAYEIYFERRIHVSLACCRRVNSDWTNSFPRLITRSLPVLLLIPIDLLCTDLCGSLLWSCTSTWIGRLSRETLEEHSRRIDTQGKVKTDTESWLQIILAIRTHCFGYDSYECEWVILWRRHH